MKCLECDGVGHHYPDCPNAKQMAPDNVHQFHAAHDKKASGWRVDVGPIAWRPDGKADAALKKAIAYRLAFVWNMAEGIPTSALEAGVVADFYDAVRGLLLVLDGPSGEAMSKTARELLDTIRVKLAAHEFAPVLCRCRRPER